MPGFFFTQKWLGNTSLKEKGSENIMKFGITGSSPITEYQLVKFSQANNIFDKDEILSFYIKYAIEFNIRVDVAFCMAAIYTNFFQNPIENNNIVGIGIQCGGTKIEKFNSIEDCIKAQFEILQKGSTGVSEERYSNLVRRFPEGNITNTDELYKIMEYDKLTNYSVYEFNTFIREIVRTRKEAVDWEGKDSYYYIRVKTSNNRQEIIRLRSELKDKKIDESIIFITAKDGNYNLEVGRYQSPYQTGIVLSNLKMFGYNGEMEFRVEK